EAQVAEGLGAEHGLGPPRRHLRDREVEQMGGIVVVIEQVGRADVVVHIEADEVSPGAGVVDGDAPGGTTGTYAEAAGPANGVEQIDPRGGEGGAPSGGGLADADDPGLAAPVEKELLDGVTALAHRVEPAELALEIGEAEDLQGVIHRAAGEVID